MVTAFFLKYYPVMGLYAFLLLATWAVARVEERNQKLIDEEQKMSEQSEVMKTLGIKVYEIMYSMCQEAVMKHGEILKCKDGCGQFLEEWEQCFTFDLWSENSIIVMFYFNTKVNPSTRAIMREVNYGAA